MHLRELQSFSSELNKIAGVTGAISRGAELLSGSGAKRIANSVKLHGEAAKSLAAKGSTVANLHREAGEIASKRLAAEAPKVMGARAAAGGVAAAGAAGAGLAAHKEEPKTAADLTPEARSELPKKDFAVSAKKSNTGEKAYPIPDRQHASSALGFAKMHGDSADLAAVRAKIQAKYPDMLQGKTAMRSDVMTSFAKEAGNFMSSLANGANAHRAELAGLGVLAAPSIDDAQAHIRAGLAGDKGPGAVEKRTFLPSAAKPASEIAGLGILAAPAAAALRHH
jgi:hypothetical protein